MRKLIESTPISLDGVIEAPERRAIVDAEDTALSLEQPGNHDAFVMGQVTLCLPKISSAQLGQLVDFGRAVCAGCSPEVRSLRHDGRLCCFDLPS